MMRLRVLAVTVVETGAPGAVLAVMVVTVVVVMVVVVVQVAAVAVGLDPPAVAAADHAFVVVLAPAGGHAVMVLEEVARLVHQRRVAPARQHEPLTAPVVPACAHVQPKGHKSSLILRKIRLKFTTRFTVDNDEAVGTGTCFDEAVGTVQ